MIAFVPFLVLIALLICCITVFGNATLDEAIEAFKVKIKTVYPDLKTDKIGR